MLKLMFNYHYVKNLENSLILNYSVDVLALKPK